ncbi:hypothetical protein [Geobacter sulfurreducens]|uniref:hypothetical protein n=1 Tax=Geobacter sulfurreducens TaxID=35554 RepID=UPI000DBB6FFF|nr:hypothetical protein [Geobacter sulfurreducens]BBA69286.1 hypothetical protein YM18_0738 [Geobacter sulfurreducens]
MPGKIALAAIILLAAVSAVRAAAPPAPSQPAPVATSASPERDESDRVSPVNLLPATDPSDRNLSRPGAAPRPAPAPAANGSIQHEFHGGFTTIFSTTNGIPR